MNYHTQEIEKDIKKFEKKLKLLNYIVVYQLITFVIVILLAPTPLYITLGTVSALYSIIWRELTKMFINSLYIDLKYFRD